MNPLFSLILAVAFGQSPADGRPLEEGVVPAEVGEADVVPPSDAPTENAAEGGQAGLPTASSTEAQGLTEPPALEVPSPELAKARAREVALGLRCPVCQGLSVADSHAEAAQAMYARIEELVRLGYSAEQINAYFADRYGAWVQLEPPAQGFSWLLWLTPVLLVVLGAAGIAIQARGRPLHTPPTVAEKPPAKSSDPYRAAVLAELGEDDP